MNRLESKLDQLKNDGRKALVAFVTAGYPDLKATVELVKLFADNGVDVVELGVPFSDPIADGPTIQFASEASLSAGTTLSKILASVAEVRRATEMPIVLMSYLNPLYHGGLDRTMAAVRRSGADGFIIPDTIPEESAELKELCAKNSLSLMFMAAPNTPDERLAYVDSQSSGFVYVVSLTGVTGGRKELPRSILKYLDRTRARMKSHRRFIGFGISGPEQVRQLRDRVDGVIVGSAIIDIIRKAKNRKERDAKLSALLHSLRNALDR